MSAYEDEDGIGGPFEKAIARAIAEDRRARDPADRLTRDSTPEDILCMRCGAKPGVMCHTRRGNVSRYWHGRRGDDRNMLLGLDRLGRTFEEQCADAAESKRLRDELAADRSWIGPA